MWREITKRFIDEHRLNIEEYTVLLANSHDEELKNILREEAVRISRRYYGNQVFIRGLIEFTNYCKNNCNYCGIQCSNANITRYRLKKEDILSCCREGYQIGFRTFVLQGGEDPWYTEDRMADIVHAIRGEFPDCAITLSVGEKEKDTYRVWKEAGADRYLLRHETADEALYRFLHPESMSLGHRKQCLLWLKELGYQTGAGFMVGAPGQRIGHLAKDLIYLQELKPEMVGIGPFIPHHDTIYAKEKAGSIDMTLFLLSVIRIMLPKVLLPATTALGTMDSEGREKGLLHGANVIMPNLSPKKNRKDYTLYDGKISDGEEAAQNLSLLKQKVEKVGYSIVIGRGDALK